MSNRISYCVGITKEGTALEKISLVGGTYKLWCWLTDCPSFREFEDTVSCSDDFGTEDWEETFLEINLEDFVKGMLEHGLRLSDSVGTPYVTFDGRNGVLSYFFKGQEPSRVVFDYG